MNQELKRALFIISKRKISLILCLILGIVSAQVYLMLKPPVTKSTVLIELNARDKALFNEGSLSDAFWTTDMLNMIKLQWDVWNTIFPQEKGQLSIRGLKGNFDITVSFPVSGDMNYQIGVGHGSWSRYRLQLACA